MPDAAYSGAWRQQLVEVTAPAGGFSPARWPRTFAQSRIDSIRPRKRRAVSGFAAQSGSRIWRTRVTSIAPTGRLADDGRGIALERTFTIPPVLQTAPAGPAREEIDGGRPVEGHGPSGGFSDCCAIGVALEFRIEVGGAQFAAFLRPLAGLREGDHGERGEAHVLVLETIDP
jgi:hypothetical protein